MALYKIIDSFTGFLIPRTVQQIKKGGSWKRNKVNDIKNLKSLKYHSSNLLIYLLLRLTKYSTHLVQFSWLPSPNNKRILKTMLQWKFGRFHFLHSLRTFLSLYRRISDHIFDCWQRIDILCNISSIRSETMMNKIFLMQGNL